MAPFFMSTSGLHNYRQIRDGCDMTDLRPATPADLANVQTLVHAAYAPHAKRMGQKPGPMLDDYAALIDQGCITVADQNSTLVALLVLMDQPDYLLLDNIAVSPHHQGSGAARRLMGHAEDQAQARGYSEIRLYTHVSMVENQAIYRHYGYQELYRATERRLTRVYFGKAIAPKL